MAERAMQRNNQSPMGMGQPGRRGGRQQMQQTILRPEDQEMFGQGQPPNVYPEPPQWRERNVVPEEEGRGPGPQALPERQPMPHWSPYTSQIGGGTGGASGGRPVFDPSRNGGVNPGGVPRLNPQTGQYEVPPQPQTPYQQAGQPGLYDAFQQSVQNGYTDIQGTDPWQTGQFMNQLSGFNTNGWGTGERGTGTLKNKFGQVASNYDVTQPGALAKLIQDPRIQEMTGGKATIVQHENQDLFDPDGDGPMAPIDVIQAATAGGAGQAWAWQPTDAGGGGLTGGPGGPAMQAYMQGMPQIQNQQYGQPQMLDGSPQVGDQNSAMQFLQWLMQQQRQGQMPQYSTQRGI